MPLTLGNLGGGMKEILAGFKEAFGSAPFRKLCFSTFLIFNAFNTVAAFSFFIVVYHLFNGIRHLFWDAGKGFGIGTVYRSGYAVIVLALGSTAAIWWLAASSGVTP